MSDKAPLHRREGRLPPGSGLAVTALFGAIALAAMLILHASGAGTWLLAAVWLGTPAAVLLALFSETGTPRQAPRFREGRSHG
ncbi:hypothetical protein [Salipiger sp.]|uniref:hypothetical protein n=1 Tax=Salipiger sp. TaxID=2078585 RepID=UPI003A983983